MIAKAQLKFARGSARKIRQVIDLIRGLTVDEAQSVLFSLNKRSTSMLSKLLHSAVSNAKVKGMKEGDLYISRIIADEGPRWKRFRAAAFGRATQILKRTSHVTIELNLKAPKPKPKIQPKQALKPKPKLRLKREKTTKKK